MRDEFYLCGLTYSALEMHKSGSRKISDHVKKKKKQEGSYFGLRNNEFCLCGPTKSKYSMLKCIFSFSFGSFGL